MSYAEFLKSKAWKEKRLEKLYSVNWMCERCNNRAVDVHHTTYQYGWLCDLEHLEALCRECHRQEHEEQPFTLKDLERKVRDFFSR